MSNTNPYPIDYTSRDYAALRDDLVKLVRNRIGVDWQADDPSDLGVILLEAFAYMGDILNYHLDRAANEAFVDTATKRESLLNLSTLFGYRPSGPTPANVTLTFTNLGESPIDLPAGTQVIAPLQYGDYSEVFFETTAAVTQLAPNSPIAVAAVEGKTANTDRPDLIDPATNLPLPVALGSSSGATNITLTLPDTGIVDGSVKVYVGQGVAFTEWKYVDSLLEWGPNDQVFTTKVNVDGSSSIVFGDGINGAIPSPSQLISSSYRVSAGVAGNITSGQVTEVSFIPGNIDPNASSSLRVENQEAATGGSDADDNIQTRAKLRRAIAARRRAVTLTDYEALAVQVPRVGRARAVADIYSAVSLFIQPQNDFTISPGIDPETGESTLAMETLIVDVQEYMKDKIPVSTTLSVFPPNYVDVSLAVILNIGSAYKRNTIQQAASQALLDLNTGLFSYYNYGLGDTIAFSDVVSTLSAIDGVKSVTIDVMDKTGLSGAGDIELAPDELPRLLSQNLDIVVIGGLL